MTIIPECYRLNQNPILHQLNNHQDKIRSFKKIPLLASLGKTKSKCISRGHIAIALKQH